jgi:hypothetical protein
VSSIEYLDAAHEAYRRLKWAEANRPDPETLEALEKERGAEAYRAKVTRLRRGVA